MDYSDSIARLENSHGRATKEETTAIYSMSLLQLAFFLMLPQEGPSKPTAEPKSMDRILVATICVIRVNTIWPKTIIESPVSSYRAHRCAQGKFLCREVAEKLAGKFGELPGKSGDFPEARESLTPSQRLAEFAYNVQWVLMAPHPDGFPP